MVPGVKVVVAIVPHFGGVATAGRFADLLGPGVDVVAVEDLDANGAADLADAQAIVTVFVPVSAAHVAAAPRLRLIQCPSHGFDHVDLDAAAAAGVPVCNVGTSGAEAHNVAEHTLLLVLALAKRLVEGHNGLREGRWPADELQALGMTELAGRTLGVVGFGTIGREVARRAQAFGMDVRYTGRRRLDPAEEAAAGVAWRRLDDLLAEADVVSLHVPLTRETRHLLDARRLALMKPAALLVNTSREALVDTAALADALKAGRLGGAGYDVFDPEPPPPEHPLLHAPRVVLSPHSAGTSGDSVARIIEAAAANVRRLAQGQPLRDVVNDVPKPTRGPAELT
jgi:phosphoglycerate dehydrogenase-like enzyme